MPPKENTVAGLLIGQEIEHYKLVESPKEHCLQAASCDLTVGDRHYLYESSGTWKAIFLGDANELAEENKDLPSGSPLLLTTPAQGGKKLIIPPFGSAIIQLAETVDLLTVADNSKLLIAGRFDLKLKSIYKGLISQQATQVEPCYRGKLYCFVHNLGAQEVILNVGEKIATIEFSYVGQGLTKEERKKVIDEAKAHNETKYEHSRFAFEKQGIKDVRWLYAQSTLPKECGIAPIYNLVHDSIEDKVNRHLEKSDTVDKLTERVGNKLSERQNVIKIVISLVVAVITFFTTSLLFEVQAELRYFSEELAFFAENQVSDTALAAIQEHTAQLASLRGGLTYMTLGFIGSLAVLLLIFLFVYMRPKHEQKWEHKLNALTAKQKYLEEKAKQSPDKAGA